MDTQGGRAAFRILIEFQLTADGLRLSCGLLKVFRNLPRGSMPTIAFVSPKGGAGKTTSAFLLSTALAKLYNVTVIDADPNHPIKNWASSGNAPERLTIISDADEDNIIERIEDAASKTPFVIVDLEGTAAKIVIYAIAQADFVVVPTQGSQLDANEASRAIRVILQSQKLKKSLIPYAVLLTRTSSSIRTRGLAHIQKGMVAAGIPVLNTELNERDAFKAVFAFQQTLDQMNPNEVPNLDKAKLNVWELAHEILERLRETQSRGPEEHNTTTEAKAGAA
jgi:chromosome partitioning protein